MHKFGVELSFMVKYNAGEQEKIGHFCFFTVPMFGQNMNGGLPLMLEGYIDEINDFPNQIIMFINYLLVLVNYLN